MQKIKTAGILLILIVGAVVAAQERETSPVSLEKISENIYQIVGGSGANGGVIIGENGILVIDAKMDKESVEQSIEAIIEISDKPLRYLVNTHSDGDHIMGNRYFPGNVTIIAHENCRDDFFKENFGRESDWGEPEYYPFTPSITFRDKLTVWLGKDQVELYYFGAGHTTGDIVVYVPGEKTAFVGDLYFSDRPQLIHSVKNGNSFEYVRTITTMLETLDAVTFLSGHSDPAERGDIENHILGMVERQEKVKELIGLDKNLTEILEEFGEDESRLVTSIYNELTGE
jgi:glyoxylase-like metal-dependent hydrolase (beta-lactamase superfamily II)